MIKLCKAAECRILRSMLIVAILISSLPAEILAQDPGKPQTPPVDPDGTIRVPSFTVPVSPLASAKADRNFLDFIHGFQALANGPPSGNIQEARRRLDDLLMRPGVEQLRRVFPVKITPEKIGGVQTDVIEPLVGISPGNANRVLINLHGGGFQVGAGLGGQMESIPIASLGSIKVISVNYREGPENRFPAASEDVAAVYRSLLRNYPSQNIGIYGCSAGGMLTAESVAWFQANGLPRPGAIGIFGAGALIPIMGDSNYIGSVLTGAASPTPTDAKTLMPYFDVADLNIRDALVSPAYHASVLAQFPPTLLLSGTRDAALSPAVYTQAQLVRAGVEADLHVWEGAPHCIFAQPIVDPSVPETREAWDVIVKFFDKQLGR